MSRALNVISLLVGLLGLGSLGLDHAQLVDIGPAGQTLSIVAAVGLLLWQKLPDADKDGTPDVFEGFWPWLRSRLPWTLLLLCAVTIGCGGYIERGLQYQRAAAIVDSDQTSTRVLINAEADLVTAVGEVDILPFVRLEVDHLTQHVELIVQLGTALVGFYGVAAELRLDTASNVFELCARYGEPGQPTSRICTPLRSTDDDEQSVEGGTE